MALARHLIDDLGKVTVHLVLIGFLCVFGSQYKFGKEWLSMAILSIPNLDLRSSMLVYIISCFILDYETLIKLGAFVILVSKMFSLYSENH